MDPLEPIERTESTDVQRPAPQVTSVPRRSKAPRVLGVLFVLALIACGVLGWMVYGQNGRKSSLDNEVKAKDEQITQLEAAKATSENAVSDHTTTDTSNTDSEMMIKAALAYSKAYVNSKGTLSATVGKQSGSFAQVTVTTTAGSGASGVYLKKVGTDWVVIGDGTSNMTSLEDNFGLPKDF
jgi:uncharacterized protein HemX